MNEQRACVVYQSDQTNVRCDLGSSKSEMTVDDGDNEQMR